MVHIADGLTENGPEGLGRGFAAFFLIFSGAVRRG
jgi:hypothetical protein